MSTSEAVANFFSRLKEVFKDNWKAAISTLVAVIGVIAIAVNVQGLYVWLENLIKQEVTVSGGAAQLSMRLVISSAIALGLVVTFFVVTIVLLVDSASLRRGTPRSRSLIKSTYKWPRYATKLIRTGTEEWWSTLRSRRDIPVFEFSIFYPESLWPITCEVINADSGKKEEIRRAGMRGWKYTFLEARADTRNYTLQFKREKV